MGTRGGERDRARANNERAGQNHPWYVQKSPPGVA